jgi:hypothetical protein
MLSVCNGLSAQPVDATHALNRSAGVSKPKVLRGRSFNWHATALSFACECTDKSVPLGKYCLNNRLVFSLEPRCQGLFHGVGKGNILDSSENRLLPK